LTSFNCSNVSTPSFLYLYCLLIARASCLPAQISNLRMFAVKEKEKMEPGSRRTE